MRFFRHHAPDAGFGIEASSREGLGVLEAGEIWSPQTRPIRWHANRGWEVYLQNNGQSRWKIDGGQTFTVPPQGAYLIQPGVRHRLVELTDEQTHFIYVVIVPEAIPAALRAAACWAQSHRVLPQARRLRHPLQGIIDEVAMREPGQAEACAGYVAALCAALVRLTGATRAEVEGERHPAAARARSLLESRLGHPWRLRELARLAGVSVPHLVVLCQQDYDVTPMRLLRQLRLEEARRQLRHTDRRVTEIALDLGFSSSQHLAQSFRAHFGQTPTEARG